VPLVQYRDEKISEGSAANTARLNLAIISHLFEIARKKWGMEGLANPVKSIRVPFHQTYANLLITKQTCR